MALPDGVNDMAQESAPEQIPGYVIEIAVAPDGTFTVSKEPAKEEMQEAPAVEGMPPAASSGESYQSVGEMLKAVLAMVNENPVSGDGQAQFDSGFGAKKPEAGPKVAQRF